MIVVRDIFQLRFGKAREAKALLKEGIALIESSGFKIDRVLADVTGPYYTMVLESTHKSLTDYERTENGHSADGRWKTWYEKFVPLVESGRREIYQVVER